MQLEIRPSRGFSVWGVVVGVAAVGVVVACAAPAYLRDRESQQLQGATEVVASQIRMARAMALRSGTDLPVLFETDAHGPTYKIVDHDGSVRVSGRLPNTLMYEASTNRKLTLEKNGRASSPGQVILCNYSGTCDTVSIERTGRVIAH